MGKEIPYCKKNVKGGGEPFESFFPHNFYLLGFHTHIVVICIAKTHVFTLYTCTVHFVTLYHNRFCTFYVSDIR